MLSEVPSFPYNHLCHLTSVYASSRGYRLLCHISQVIVYNIPAKRNLNLYIISKDVGTLPFISPLGRDPILTTTIARVLSLVAIYISNFIVLTFSSYQPWNPPTILRTSISHLGCNFVLNINSATTLFTHWPAEIPSCHTPGYLLRWATLLFETPNPVVLCCG